MTKAQKEYAEKFFKEFPEVKELHLNPQGEWFTDINYANNSLPKKEEGKKESKIETIKKGQKIDASDEPK
ncbi:hypothetical protein EG352_07280 [Chryseobacterium indologenes]|uniref:Uncharacterized protein n=1 Tax=Chryseobacterium indologenes TaxID=253 RepID=A0AAD0YVR0_CHRID|nr:hypothetical protein [Chryseobacterium indologenes]AZB17581.1 hypothetical protein EG352_07280 [Chryseobacterium indologenes]